MNYITRTKKPLLHLNFTHSISAKITASVKKKTELYPFPRAKKIFLHLNCTHFLRAKYTASFWTLFILQRAKKKKSSAYEFIHFKREKQCCFIGTAHLPKSTASFELYPFNEGKNCPPSWWWSCFIMLQDVNGSRVGTRTLKISWPWHLTVDNNHLTIAFVEVLSIWIL